ncbi:MAG TPA: EMC3/TMCO1 family protein [Thermoplasmata archaeon]|nr:EMC3/TMCO1 family protein [Thermoplasmata archaeon]
MSDPDAPLPSGADEETEGEEEEAEGTGPETPAETAPPARPRPPPPTFKVTTFLYVFLGLLGLWMLIDQPLRNSIACGMGMVNASQCPTSGPWGLYWLIGFHSNYLLATMLFAGGIEMFVTALAYNYTTDWIKAAKVQKWSSAFRKVQMEAIRSGKKDRIAALKPHQERLTRLSSEVTIAQFKGMAVTYFLLILIYTWVGLIIGGANPVQQTVSLGGTSINLYHTLWGPIPWWFIIFSLYTVPFSLIFRRVLKHLWLRKYAEEHKLVLGGASPAVTLSGRSA